MAMHSGGHSGTSTPAARAPHHHQVQFYASDRYLSEAVGVYLAPAVGKARPALVVATPDHRRAFTERLRAAGHDVDGLEAEGRLRHVDARELLDTFMIGGAPDAARFQRHVGGLVRQSQHGRGPVRVYGEMVDLLLQDGRPDAALEVEALWNGLAAAEPFTLLCAYALDRFAAVEDAALLHRVCGQHSHVFPAETFRAAGSQDARLREIVVLQQRARALETELARRAALEADLVRAFEAERAARADAEAAVRVKDEFVAAVSHELRTPLNAIVGWARILGGGKTGDQAMLQHAIDVIRRNAERQGRLIEDLLDFSTIASGRLRLAVGPVDLAAVLAAAVEAVRPQADARHLLLRLEVDAAVPAIQADQARVEQIVSNLLSNALKFTPDHGWVTLRLEAAPDAVRLVVQDSGQGIAPDFLPHAFDRFRQADGSTTRRHGGIGLGLALVRALAEAHGGSVLAESDGPGLGATFTVVLPVRPDEARSAEA